jgi:predicted phage tail protein
MSDIEGNEFCVELSAVERNARLTGAPTHRRVPGLTRWLGATRLRMRTESGKKRDNGQTARNARDETPVQRADRNFGELLQELRVTQTGIQILFAFLLTLAFTARFPTLDSFQRGTYVATLMLSVVSAALFTAPAALHRILFQQGAKQEIVRVSSRLAGAGMAVLMLALTGSALLVVDVVLGRMEGLFAGAGTFVVCAGLWGVLPGLVRRRVEREQQDTQGTATTGATAPTGATGTAQGAARSAGSARERRMRHQ